MVCIEEPERRDAIVKKRDYGGEEGNGLQT